MENSRNPQRNVVSSLFPIAISQNSMKDCLSSVSSAGVNGDKNV